jgi:hypothetical protein
MTAERNHYTKQIICYNKYCEQQGMELGRIENSVSSSKAILIVNKAGSDSSNSR